MRRCNVVLLALSLTLLVIPATTLAEEAATFNGTVETGITLKDVTDDPSRVDEYVKYRKGKGAGVYGKVDLEASKDGVLFDVSGDFMGPKDQAAEGQLDLNRIFRITSEYTALQKWNDHEKLDYMNATSLPVAGTSNPNPAIYSEDLAVDKDFLTTRREWINNADIALPGLPNWTFHAGYRTETREGLEQAVNMSKCASCHVVGKGKNINESTNDISAGVTGRVGMFTLVYSYLNRTFTEGADAPMYRYDPAYAPNAAVPNYNQFDPRLLYKYPDELPYSYTPDSKKDSHVVKARADVTEQANITASYVNTVVESDIGAISANDPGVAFDKTTLQNDYNSGKLRLTTKIGDNMRFNLTGRYEKVDGDPLTVTYTALNGDTLFNDPPTRISAESREVTTIGADFIWRLAKRTNLLLKYVYKNVDREDEHLGETESHTGKITYKSRPSREWSYLVSYEYQSIDNPFHNPGALEAPFINTADAPTGAFGVMYGDAYYERREGDASNQPEMVNEGKLSVTWSPSTTFSTTLYGRVAMEENELNMSTYKKTTYVPGATFWYAPSTDMNFTLAYNFIYEDTENKMCAGWYHG